MTTLTTLGETIWIDGVQWTYIVKDEGVQIGTGELFDTAIPRDTLGAISVPAEINGLPVVEIASHAFYSLQYVYKIDIPTSVSTIGYRVFADCRNLESVLLPDGVSIGGNAFSFSDKIEYPVFSKTGKSLYAFSSDQTTSPATSYIVPNGVEFIGNNAFASAGKMTSISWPDSLKCIGEYAFRDCPFENVEIPSSVTNIGEGAFSGCRNLCSIALPDTLESINGSTFWRCCSLTNIAIPDSVNQIGPGAFSDCSSLKSISIPAAVTNIGRGAFSGCCRLESVEVDPANGSYKSQGLVLFSKDGAELNAFLEFQSQTYDIPNSVRIINEFAFYGCSNLTELAIPNSVTNIGNWAFGGCSGMTALCLPRSFRGKTANLGIPSGCSVFFFGPCSFQVVSERGSPRPAPGIHDAMDGETIECSVSGIDDADHVEGVRYVCSGWRGTGSVPVSGEGTNVTFTITEDSSIVWLWETNAWLDCSLTVDGRSTNFVDWISVSNEPFVIPVALLSETLRIFLSGETNGVAVDATSGTVSIPANGPRTLSIRIESITADGSVATDGKPVAFSGGGDAEWFPMADASAADGFCLRSGEIEANETSSAEATLIGPGTLSFVWKISAGRGDSCKFYLDGTETNSIATRNGAMTDWATVALDVPAGEHVVRWNYERGAGSAAGEDAAFLDDVDWRPTVSLAVASAWGATTPEAGTHGLVYGDEVAASVAEPAVVDGTRRVCVGWTGTGSVPAGGDGTNVAFRIEEDSTLAWNWRTDHWIGLLVSGGTADFEPQWVEAGTEVVAEIVPATHLYAVALAGDTNGVTLAGTTLTIPADGPREIAVTVEEAKLVFAVESEWGAPSPTNGVYALSWGTEIEASVAEPEPTDGVRYVCAGWTGTGSVPAGGDGTNVSFRIEEDSTLAWNWRTNVWIALAASGPVSVNFAEAWTNLGETVVAGWTPSVPYFTVALSDDADGVTLDEAARTVSIPADRPRSVALSVTELTLAEALDAPGLVWTTDGDAGWFPQVATSADGEDAARSGNVPVNGTSALQTVLEGPGTFAWTWRLDAAGNFGVDVFLDGIWQSTYAPGANWSDETLLIVGEGEHTMRFEFWNEGTVATPGDCAYLDRVSWTGEVPGGRKVAVEGVEIPFAWIETNAPAALAAADDDYETAAKAMAANGANKVWECYVAGLDPTNATSRFFAEIDATVDPPRVTWTPDLKEGVDQAWGPTNEASRFFRVKVGMP